MLDEDIIKLFFDRSEEAIKELEEKYGKACFQISYNILANRNDAEECVNDSYLGVWNSIPPAKPDPLLTYVLKIVRNISLNRYRRNQAAKRNSTYDLVVEEMDEYLASKDSIENVMETRELSEAIEGFLDSLKSENRVIFVRRYWFFDTYEQIAKRTRLSEKNVSVRLTRMRKELREYLEERGIYL